VTQNSDAQYAEFLAKYIADSIEGGRRETITWLNHYSAVKDLRAQVELDCFTLVGVDGIFLRRILESDGTPRSIPRTSADLVMPLLIPRLRNCSLGFVGSTDTGITQAYSIISKLLDPSCKIELLVNGYDSLPEPQLLAEATPELDVLVLGLGAPLQDVYAASIASHSVGPTVIITCGGWLDQVGQPGYYPSWAYQLKMNWLIRLLREPRRLWKRYSLDAYRALAMRRRIRSTFQRSAAFQTYVEILTESSQVS
jgi:UDP-N-acetyl-D-mannosaminuronic acid transferase (WecB/TagA/CpsF family)